MIKTKLDSISKLYSHYGKARYAVSALTLLIVAGCGGENPGVGSTVGSGPDDEAAEAFGEALGAGRGGGTLIFDGTTYPIESAVCTLEPPVQVGTVGEGYRVLIGGSERYPDVSILAPGSVHWTALNDIFSVSGSQITGDSDTYRNNVDGGTVEASFEIECP